MKNKKNNYNLKKEVSAMNMQNMNSRIIETGEVIITNMHLFEKWSYSDHQRPRYSCTIIIRKQDKETLRKLKNAIRLALEEGKEKIFGGEIPERTELTMPLKNGEDASMRNILYSDSVYLNASSPFKLKILDKYGKELFPYNLPDAMFGTAKLLCKAYNIENSGKKGVACNLIEVKLIRDIEVKDLFDISDPE